MFTHSTVVSFLVIITKTQIGEPIQTSLQIMAAVESKIRVTRDKYKLLHSEMRIKGRRRALSARL